MKSQIWDLVGLKSKFGPKKVPILHASPKGAGASEAPGQTKEEFSANDTSRDPKVLKIGPQHG